MPISWRTDYAIRLMVESATTPGARRTVRELSSAGQVPYDYARLIVHELVGGGLLESRRGVGGGVSLARRAEDISILDVLRAMDESATLALCTDGPDGCGRIDTCPVHARVWEGLDRLTADYLAGVSLADIVAEAHSASDAPDRAAG